MIKYAVYTRDRLRGDLFDDLGKAIQFAGEVAVDLGFDAGDIDITDSLQNKRHWKAIDRERKRLLEPWIELSAQAISHLESLFQADKLGEGEDKVWIEPGGDVHVFESATGCSRKYGTVDALSEEVLTEHSCAATRPGLNR